MVFQKGDAVIIQFPFTDLTVAKARPAIVVSSTTYHETEPDLILAALTTNLAAAAAPVDYILKDWAAAGLRHPSALKPLLFTLDPALVLHRVGVLTWRDLAEVDRRLRRAMGLTATVLEDVLTEVDFTRQSPATVQALAEKSVAAVRDFSVKGDGGVAPGRLLTLLSGR